MQDYVEALAKGADFGLYFTVEADFAGTHIGEFAGIVPAGRPVRAPYTVVYDLCGGQISALRIYFP